MEVKTVLNLEADAGDLCQDAITYTQEVSGQYDQQIFYSVFTEMDQERASGDRILDSFSSSSCFWSYRQFVSLLFLTRRLGFHPTSWFLIGISHN